MTKKKESINDSIPNWSIFGTHSVAMEFHPVEDEKHVLMLTVILNDGTELEDDTMKAITFATDIIVEEVLKELPVVATTVAPLFNNIQRAVLVFDDDGDIQKEYDLEDVMKRSSKKKTNNATFH